MAISDDVLTSLPAEPLAEISRKIEDGDILLCSATDAGSLKTARSVRVRGAVMIATP